MSTTYKLQMKFAGDNDVSRSLTINGADSAVTKASIDDFADSYKEIYTDVTTVTAANLVTTTVDDKLID